MKKIALCLAAIMVFSLTVTGCKSVKENPITDFEYTTNETGVIITGYLGESDTVVIPQNIEGIPVVSIGISAFDFLDITSVTLPDSVTTISYNAFAHCQSLKEINFGKGVKEIRNNAFQGCKSLEKIILPSGIESIGAYAFFECLAVREIYVPNSIVNGCGMYAFANNEAVTTIEFEKGINTIGGDFVFAGATSLETVTIPAGVEEIGNYAFVGCTKLESVKFLGDAPKTVGKRALGQDKKELKVYYKKGASGWDNTPLADEYTLVRY